MRVGIGMISRGEVGLIVAGVGLSSGVLTGDVYTTIVLMVAVTTIITPIWLKMDYRNGYTGKLKRLMMHHPWVDPKQASNWQHHRDNLIFMHQMRRQLCNPFILWISTS